MSLRSGSPCTSTSRPMSSWRRITRSISPFIRSMYFPSSISPLRRRMRAVRISAVCGNEPIVVVGNSGSPSRSCWASRRVGERALAAGVGVGHLLEPLAHLRVAGAGRVAPVLERLAVLLELLADRVAALVQPARQRCHLVELLHGERHPAQDLVVEPRLVALVDRGVLQRAGRRDNQVVARVAAQLVEQVEARRDVVDPHVAAVHDAREQGLVLRPPVLATSSRLCGP